MASVAVWMLLLVTVVACAAPDGGGPDDQGGADAAATLDHPLRFHHSSAWIVGGSHVLVIGTDGAADLQVGSESTSFTLSDDELDRVARAVAAARLEDLPDQIHTDPREDDTVYGFGYGAVAVEADHVAAPPALRDLAEMLTALIDDHLPDP